MRKILCAAIHYNDGKEYVHQPKNIKSGFVVSGRRHHNCIQTMVVLSGKMLAERIRDEVEETQGFITSDDAFVNRFDAYKIAEENNQLLNKHSNGKLYSEDLY